MSPKRSIILVIVCICGNAIIARAYDGRQLLQRALDTQQTASFSATAKIPMENRYQEGKQNNIWVPCRYDRLVTSDGTINKRLEFNDTKGVETVYLENASGQYGHLLDLTARIEEIPALFLLELLYYPIPKSDWEASTFSVESSSYHGRPCYEVIVKTPSDNITLQHSRRKPVPSSRQTGPVI